MQFVMTCAAGSMISLSLPPSLKPLPSPSKGSKPQRLSPLPQAYVVSTVTGDLNSLRKSE